MIQYMVLSTYSLLMLNEYLCKIKGYQIIFQVFFSNSLQFSINDVNPQILMPYATGRDYYTILNCYAGCQKLGLCQNLGLDFEENETHFCEYDQETLY